MSNFIEILRFARIRVPCKTRFASVTFLGRAWRMDNLHLRGMQCGRDAAGRPVYAVHDRITQRGVDAVLVARGLPASHGLRAA